MKSIFNYLKAMLVFKKASIKKNIYVGRNLTVYYPKKLDVIGRCHFGDDFFLDARGGCTIEDNVIFAPKVSILTYNHDYKSLEWLPYSPEIVEKKVCIGEGCWIGYGVIILPGTVIGKGSVIGAGAVVRGRFEDGSVIAGNPAIKISNRRIENVKYNYLLEKEKSLG